MSFSFQRILGGRLPKQEDDQMQKAKEQHEKKLAVVAELRREVDAMEALDRSAGNKNQVLLLTCFITYSCVYLIELLPIFMLFSGVEKSVG